MAAGALCTAALELNGGAFVEKILHMLWIGHESASEGGAIVPTKVGERVAASCYSGRCAGVEIP